MDGWMDDLYSYNAAYKQGNNSFSCVLKTQGAQIYHRYIIQTCNVIRIIPPNKAVIIVELWAKQIEKAISLTEKKDGHRNLSLTSQRLCTCGGGSFCLPK